MSADGLRLRARVERRALDVEFTVAAGEVLAVLGPNGAGKSTLLHVIAGLLTPDDGLVRCGDRVLTDTAAGVDVATRDRRVGLLLQNPLLFPHLSVAANVAFGPQARHRRPPGRARTRAAADRWLRAVDAVDLADRRPRQLSGGQAQRVAIARALAAEPDLLLLDEPLAGLDVAAAAAVRAVLREVLADAGRTAVLVTHDLLDVFALADRVLVLEAGRIGELGPAGAVLTAPRSRFGAQIAGLNLVAGTFGPDGALHSADAQRWWGGAEPGLAAGQDAVAVFGPRAVTVHRQSPPGDPRNCLTVTVAGLAARGATIAVRALDQPDGAPGLQAELTAETAAQLRLVPGERVLFAVDAAAVALHAAGPRR